MELKPLARSTNHLAARLPLFPASTTVATQGEQSTMTIAGCDIAALAAQYGTPLYLYDGTTMDACLESYRTALAAHYPGPSGITYAGKAFLCLGMAQWVDRSGLWLDCTGAGELHIAAAAGLPRQRTLVHGVNKSRADLDAALHQAGVLVVDHLSELFDLAERYDPAQPFPQLWLRWKPGVAVETHSYTQTGQSDSKFGMDREEIVDAVQLCQAKGLPLTGLHFHQGSHFHNPGPLSPAISAALDLIVQLRAGTGWTPDVLCPGGGWGVPYHEDDLPHPSAADYVQFVAQHLVAGCRQRSLTLPHLQLEPGRSLVARAGVAVYRVGAIKTTPQRRWLLIDGGLADNPRPALYGARYSALPVANPHRPAAGPAYLAGPFCESGDVLIEDLPLPDIQPGELLAVPVSGAYQLSMGSNYNGARKPAVLWLQDGTATLLQRRQELDDLLARDLPLPGAAH